jgi:hypothetical protein
MCKFNGSAYSTSNSKGCSERGSQRMREKRDVSWSPTKFSEQIIPTTPPRIVVRACSSSNLKRSGIRAVSPFFIGVVVPPRVLEDLDLSCPSDYKTQTQ